MPVSPVIIAAKFTVVGAANHVATPAPKPDTPVAIGKPVTLVITPEAGVPNAGVTNTGDVSVGAVANTNPPVPVSPVIAPNRFNELGTANHVATPAPSPATPVAIGKPVALVKTAAEGVPRLGVTKTGEV